VITGGATIRCDFCGNDEVKIRRLTRAYGKGDNVLVIENVPAIGCPRCGESYMTAETLHEIERLKLHRHSIAEERKVEVVRFVAA
jgi:YgiT-type zinc finger domain-containing protein